MLGGETAPVLECEWFRRWYLRQALQVSLQQIKLELAHRWTPALVKFELARCRTPALDVVKLSLGTYFVFAYYDIVTIKCYKI